eukprot:CAMPEP_0167755322 /NCGR_PEP_ID=MMETSP0110_2-20121227/8757_1 /TAXON_ID=629695 /ORGANISM="Gymnochlora sp., Strain CCMP2014" /LENGTH=412 /DNA_ID=CAMNT_0007641291 /DNA_START=32 /DNA_END=1270 /DNA_ORIENTATION=-
MATPMILYSSKDTSGRFIEAVASYCGLESRLEINREYKVDLSLIASDDAALQKELRARVLTSSGKALPINYPRTIARYVAKSSNNETLLGKGPLEEALVEELMSLALNGPLDSRTLAMLEKRAATNTYLGSPSGLRLGDLAVYAALHPVVAEKKGVIDALTPSLMRWFKFVQYHIEGKVPTLAPVSIKVPPSPLFTKGLSAPAAKPTKASNESKQPAKGGGKKKKNADDKAAKKAKKKAKLEAEAKVRNAKKAGKANLRVAFIKECNPSDADKTLYVSQLDLGDHVRQVVSRLGEFVPLEKMRGAKCVVVANLKEGVFGGVKSQGRILSGTHAKDAKKKCLVTPPADSKVGERIIFEGAEDIAPDAEIKEKNFKAFLKGLNVTNEVAMYTNLSFNTSAGKCMCPGLSAGTIA